MTIRCSALSAATVAAMLAVCVASRAQAAAFDLLDSNHALGIYMGNQGFPNSSDYPSVVNEKDIFLKSATGVTLGHGNVGTNNTGQPIVDFSTSTSVDVANGGGTIKDPSGLWTSLTVTVPAISTYTGAFGDLFFGVQLDDPGKVKGDQLPFDITITAFNGVNPLGTLTLTDSTTPAARTNGDVGFLVLAEGANVITSVVITSTTGFKEFKHFDISDLQLVCTSDCNGGGPGLSTPLPAALPLFAGGLGVIGLLARRRKRAAQKA